LLWCKAGYVCSMTRSKTPCCVLPPCRNFFGHVTGEDRKYLKSGTLVTTALWGLLRTWYLLEKGLVLWNRSSRASSTSSISVVVVGTLLGGGGSSLSTVMFEDGLSSYSALAPVGVGDLQEHGGKESAWDRHTCGWLGLLSEVGFSLLQIVPSRHIDNIGM
jgi:hypothetical protein